MAVYVFNLENPAGIQLFSRGSIIFPNVQSNKKSVYQSGPLVRRSHQCSLEQRIYSSVGKKISPVFRRPTFKSWLDLNVLFCHLDGHNRERLAE